MRYTVEAFKKRGKWTTRVRCGNGRILWSTTAQLYSRRVDALKAAVNFLKAVFDNRVTIKET